MNKFIGLCKNEKKWPSTLHDLGYGVQLIEYPISTKSAKKIKPDVVAVSKRLLHAIIVDCKSGGNIEAEQDRRYQEITPSDLKHCVTIHDSNQLKHCVCYIDDESNHEELKSYTDLPFITFGKDKIQGTGDFGNKELNDKLTKFITLKDSREPTFYYPFSPEDHITIIEDHVLGGMISYLKQGKNSGVRLDAEDILKKIHPLYDIMGKEHKRILIGKVKGIMDDLRTKNEIKELLEKIENGRPNKSDFNKLSRKYQEFKNTSRLTEFL